MDVYFWSLVAFVAGGIAGAIFVFMCFVVQDSSRLDKRWLESLFRNEMRQGLREVLGKLVIKINVTEDEMRFGEWRAEDHLDGEEEDSP